MEKKLLTSINLFGIFFSANSRISNDGSIPPDDIKSIGSDSVASLQICERFIMDWFRFRNPVN